MEGLETESGNMNFQNELEAALDERLVEDRASRAGGDGLEISRPRAELLAERSLQAAALAALHDWFIGDGEKTEGPFQLEQLRERWLLGQLGPDTACWREGFSGWRKLCRIPELQLALSPIPVPLTVEQLQEAAAPSPVRMSQEARVNFHPRASESLWALREAPRRPMPPPPLPPEAVTPAPRSYTPSSQPVFVQVAAPAPAAKESRLVPLTLGLVLLLVVANGAFLWKLSRDSKPVPPAPAARELPPAPAEASTSRPPPAVVRPAPAVEEAPAPAPRIRKPRAAVRPKAKDPVLEAFPGATVMTFEEAPATKKPAPAPKSEEESYQREAEALERSFDAPPPAGPLSAKVEGPAKPTVYVPPAPAGQALRE